MGIFCTTGSFQDKTFGTSLRKCYIISNQESVMDSLCRAVWEGQNFPLEEVSKCEQLPQGRLVLKLCSAMQRLVNGADEQTTRKPKLCAEQGQNFARCTGILTFRD